MQCEGLELNCFRTLWVCSIHKLGPPCTEFTKSSTADSALKVDKLGFKVIVLSIPLSTYCAILIL